MEAAREGDFTMMLATFLEESTPNLLDAVQARLSVLDRMRGARPRDTYEHAGALLRGLITAIRAGRIASGDEVALVSTAGIDVDSFLLLPRVLKETVYEAIDESGLAIPPRQMRLAADWFGTLVERVLHEATHGGAVAHANAAVLAIVAHDLRNPLSAVLMCASRFQRQPGLPDNVRDGCVRIVRSARRMNQLIGTLLDFTQLRFHRQLLLSRESVDLDAIATDVIDELRAAHPDQIIEFTTHGHLPGEWDAGRISQVLSNLVGNALTHGADDSPVEVSVSDADEDAIISVTNRGSTIPKAFHERLFEPFWQGPSDNAGASRQRGVGLGLYIVRQIVCAHGGTIDVDSNDGRTTFVVRLPRFAAGERDHAIGAEPKC
jgi:signal transduction histidine kinase